LSVTVTIPSARTPAEAPAAVGRSCHPKAREIPEDPDLGAMVDHLIEDV
jgi:hypothetical protein